MLNYGIVEWIMSNKWPACLWEINTWVPMMRGLLLCSKTIRDLMAVKWDLVGGGEVLLDGFSWTTCPMMKQMLQWSCLFLLIISLSVTSNILHKQRNVWKLAKCCRTLSPSWWKLQKTESRKKKTKGILGSSFFIRGLQLMTDEWQTQGGKISWGSNFSSP